MSWDNDGQRLWTGKDFIEYVKLRWGNPLFRRNCCWYSTGSIVSCDTGKVVALLEGLELGMVKSISQPSSNQATVEALVSSKKLYFLKDPVTGKYWTERDSKRVNPMFYPQQDTLVTWNSHTVELKRNFSVACKTLGARIIDMAGIRVYSLPTFVKLRSKKAGYISTLERYDLYRYSNIFSRFFTSPILSWTRYGDCPAWYGKGKCASYLVSKKLNNIQSLPKDFMSQVRSYDPLFLQQPLLSDGNDLSNNDEDSRRRLLGERRFLSK
ncbi:hypothetical protein GAYE_SCF07G2851 [Galdieria yellowstonensis]|uniref:Uncharacterized protein n=1 Tax=Galdieria yellowstonensis TaxID=3028027 RepID=A0AAV9IC88_9RHOD|nr:hypothetical protein GAYE_SCF07G2851 [Galdieria yellowstonensis]